MNFKICISCFDTHNYEYCVKGLISALSIIHIKDDHNIEIDLYTNKSDFCAKIQSVVDLNIRLVCYDDDVYTPKYHKIKNLQTMIKSSDHEYIDYFMFIDADTLVVENIFNIIRQNFGNQNYELLIAHELNTKIGIDQFINYNSGLLFIRPTSNILHILNDWLASYLEEVSLSKDPLKVHDQPHLRKAINHYNPVVGTLPKNCNYRGHEAQGFMDWLWDDIFVLHNHEMYRSQNITSLWISIDVVDYEIINTLTLNLISNVKRINSSIKLNSCSLIFLASGVPRKIYFFVKIMIKSFL